MRSKQFLHPTTSKKTGARDHGRYEYHRTSKKSGRYLNIIRPKLLCRSPSRVLTFAREASCHSPSTEMNTQHGEPHRSRSVRSTREGEHHAKAIHGISKWEVLGNSKRCALFIYGSRPSDQLRRQHLQNILGASVALSSREVTTPSDARTHFYQTSSPSRTLGLGILPSLTGGRGASRYREPGGDQHRRSIHLVEQRARAAEGRPTPPARTLNRAAALPSLQLRTEPCRLDVVA